MMSILRHGVRLEISDALGAGQLAGEPWAPTQERDVSPASGDSPEGLHLKESRDMPKRIGNSSIWDGEPDDRCEWCNTFHGGLWCPKSKQMREWFMHKTSFKFTLPSKNDVYVYVVAKEVTQDEAKGISVCFFNLDGDPIEMLYSKEVFDEIELIAHAAMLTEKEGKNARGSQEEDTVSGAGTEGA